MKTIAPGRNLFFNIKNKEFVSYARFFLQPGHIL